MKQCINLLAVFLLLVNTGLYSAANPSQIEFTKAGYLSVPNSGRQTFNFNVGWRFFKGKNDEAYKMDFDDSSWAIVNCPDGLELLPEEASGGMNYQGEAWYRKHFTPNKSMEKKQNRIHFEGVMGKCKVYLNGELLGEHFGGYLPFSIDLTGKLNYKKENIISVWADNSNDKFYPPGKPQSTLDFSYFGGIYRDVWITSTQSIYVTNANDENEVAGGGVFVHYDNLSKSSAEVHIQSHIRNKSTSSSSVWVEHKLIDDAGNVVSIAKQKLKANKQQAKTVSSTIVVKDPKLWSPKSPYLYRLEVIIRDKNNYIIDAVARKVGVRKIEMKGKEGFFLNNEPFDGKLMGVNRHQDFAYIGNAIPNNGHCRDAVLLKEAGCTIIRAAHYPIDPSFMEACDALGMFYIVATPGWQFWNEDPIFEKRVFSDIRNMVRRDRNYACVLMWEPILNETWYPDYFAKKVHEIVHEEYPYQGAYTVCDSGARGQETFDVIYSHPFKNAFFNNFFEDTEKHREELLIPYAEEERCVFTREWGDCVDDWNSHNSPSRVHRSWGEAAQLTQVKHYSKPEYVFTSWETLHNTPNQHIGGALWHSFDHQRGYHPDPFFGGIADAFRLPKYSYQLFASQRDVSENVDPMIYIAHEMSPFSGKDVTVFTNCDEVRLIVYEKDTLVQKVNDYNLAMPHPVVTFEDVFKFIEVKALHRRGKKEKASFVAEGFIDGKKVVSYTRMPSLRPEKIVLHLENRSIDIVANGSDVAVLVASVTDKEGNIKRLNNSLIKFEIDGEGELIGDHYNNGNPRKIEWGQAPILVRSTTKAGTIKVKAHLVMQGINCPMAGEIEFKSIATNESLLFSEIGKSNSSNSSTDTEISMSAKELEKQVQVLKKELNNLKMKEVERQQSEFEGK